MYRNGLSYLLILVGVVLLLVAAVNWFGWAQIGIGPERQVLIGIVALGLGAFRLVLTRRNIAAQAQRVDEASSSSSE